MLKIKKNAVLVSCCMLFLNTGRLSLAQETPGIDGLRGEEEKVSGLQKKIYELERNNAMLEAMLDYKFGDLRKPYLVNSGEKKPDKIIHQNLGYAYGIKGDTRQAIEEYRKVLESEPDDKDSYYNLGYLLVKEDKYEEAVIEYKKALKGSLQDKEVYYNLSLIYATRLKDMQKAKEYYQKFLQLSGASEENR